MKTILFLVQNHAMLFTLHSFSQKRKRKAFGSKFYVKIRDKSTSECTLFNVFQLLVISRAHKSSKYMTSLHNFELLVFRVFSWICTCFQIIDYSLMFCQPIQNLFFLTNPGHVHCTMYNVDPMTLSRFYPTPNVQGTMFLEIYLKYSNLCIII